MFTFYGPLHYFAQICNRSQYTLVYLIMMQPLLLDLFARYVRLFALSLLALILPALTASAMEQGASAKVKTVAAESPAKPESLTVANKHYDATKELARMVKHYSLTIDQRAKIQPLLLDQQRQIHTLGEDTSLNDTDWNASVHKVHGKTVAQIKKLMTDEQALKYAKDEAKFAKSQGDTSDDDDDHGPPDGGPPPGGGPGGPGGGGPGGGGPPGM
jgi:hypothetical protein